MSYEEDGTQNDEERLWDDDLFDGKKNVTVILIDVGSSMFDTPKIFKSCLLAVYQVIDRMLLKAYRRNIAICFMSDTGIYTALNDNIVDSAKKIVGLIKTSMKDLRVQFERKNAASLRDTLTECLRQFHNLEKINPYVVLLTNDEDPHKGEKTDNMSAFDVALSFREMNAKLIVLPLKDNFNYDIFYAELLKSANDVPLDTFEDIAEKSYAEVDDLVEILDSIIKARVKLHRHIFRLSGEQGDEITFWVQLRYLVNDNHLYHNSNTSRVTNNKVKKDIKKEAKIDPDKWCFIKTGSKIIKFDKSTKIYMRMPFGFRLLYVSDEKQSSIHNVRKRGFVLQKDEITPNDDEVQKIFDTLWEYCKEKNRYLVCGYHVPGYKQYPQIVELSPDQFQGKPCFIGQFLANSDEVIVFPKREQMDEKEPVDNRDVKAVCDVIDKLMIKYKPHNFTCIKFEKKAVQIKAQLLDTEAETAESCFRTREEIAAELGDAGEALKAVFGDPVAPPTKKRRTKK